MIFDESRLRELRDLGGDEFVAELWRAFLEICSNEIPKLESALMNDDAPAAKAISHNLRSASGNVGACGLHEVCTRIEGEAWAGPNNFPNLAALLISTYEETLSCEPASKAG